jgi:folate-binding protein YgfZ
MTRARLDDLAWLAVHGPDARKFLHGQVSQDVVGQPLDHVVLAGLHNPQGRTAAILRLVPLAGDALLLGLPAEIAAAVMLRLRRYVLRARLTLEDASATWEAAGIGGPGAGAALAAAGLRPAGPGVGALGRDGERLAWRHATDPERFIVLAPRAIGLPAAWGSADDGVARHRWHAADVAAGLPQVYAATSEAFVAQMLNLDVLQGIAFDKGCYTGQEVIARAHYRGRVKRRLQRFRTLAAGATVPAPGDTGTLADGRSVRVVDVAPLEDGRQEFLAVAPLAVGDDDAAPAAEPAPPREAASSPEPDQPAAAGRTTDAPLDVEALPLPYALPA